MRVIHNRLFWAIAVLFLASGCAHRLSDEELFRESAVAARTIEDEGDQQYAFEEIAEAQADHGYYNDALKTLNLVNQFPDQLFVELATIRAKNGDIAGAQNMAASSALDLQLRADEAIAVIQATAGDFKGARDTSQNLPDKSRVLDAIAEHEIESGDLEGALTLATQTNRGLSDELMFQVAEKYWEAGNNKRAREILLRITDLDIARKPVGVRTMRPTETTDACDLAWRDAESGMYADAYEELRTKSCHCNVAAYVYEEADDLAGAERAFRSCADSSDISYGMSELASKYAARGEISQALRCADLVHVTGASFEEGYLAPVLRDISRAWGKKEAQRTVLKWARSRPTGYQRAMALLGLAESASECRTGR